MSILPRWPFPCRLEKLIECLGDWFSDLHHTRSRRRRDGRRPGRFAAGGATMISAPIIQITAPPRRLIRLLVILSVASMALPLSNQTAMASPWAVEKFETYQQHPDWVNTRCQNMEKVNQKGLSNFTEKVASLEKEYNSNFSAQSTKEIIEFYGFFGQRFCSTAW